MTMDELIRYLRIIGIAPKVQKTGDPRWVRVFLHDLNDRFIPLSLGRASVHDGEVFNIKWYSLDHTFNPNLKEAHYYRWALYALEVERVHLLRSDYDKMLARAYEWAEAEQSKKQSRRNTLPKKKRPPLAKPNPTKFMYGAFVKFIKPTKVRF